MADSAVLVITVIGDDHPGLVGDLSAAIARRDGNWLESSMANLAGKFAGIVKLAVPPTQLEPLKADLAAIPGLAVTVALALPAATSGQRLFRLSLVGHDRRGIVREVSHALARHGVNVEELTTHVSSAPMSAEMLFHAQAQLSAPMDVDARVLASELEHISNDLMVDISVDEKIS